MITLIVHQTPGMPGVSTFYFFSIDRTVAESTSIIRFRRGIGRDRFDTAATSISRPLRQVVTTLTAGESIMPIEREEGRIGRVVDSAGIRYSVSLR